MKKRGEKMMKLLKMILVSTLTLSVLIAIPLAAHASISTVVPEVAVEEETQQIMPFTVVRVRPTGAWGFTTPAATSALWITGGPTVSVVAFHGEFVQVSGGGAAHMRWFRSHDIGFWPN